MKPIYLFFRALVWLIPLSIGIFFFWVTSGRPSEAEWFGSMALATVVIPVLVILWFIILFIDGFVSKAYRKEKLKSIEKKPKVEKKVKDRFERDKDF